MCSSKLKQQTSTTTPQTIANNINGRPVLQPKSNQVPTFTTLERKNSLIKNNSAPKSPTKSKPLSPPTPRTLRKAASFTLERTLTFESSLIVEAPGTIAAARREHVAIMQEQRKMRTAHYGRTKSCKLPNFSSPPTNGESEPGFDQPKRCNFITPNSDPIYVAYHDQEWGVPVHDDNLLLELLVLTGAQVRSDWTSVLKRRETIREAFCGFNPEVVSKFNEKKIGSVSLEYGIDICQVRGVVDNASRILEVKREFGSFDKYLWKFVNHKAMASQYRASHKMPVKSSKSESISKDMVKRGFRLVGPTVIHSFMQAAGLINDHLVTCPRHLECQLLV
ncbi:Probable GMP synthase [glutamine-hydrolyzing] [Linum grandiflorum]